MSTGLVGMSELNTLFITVIVALQSSSGQATLNVAGVAALITTFFTVAAALLYILGLIALGWPIQRVTNNLSTTLYAVSLIPKTVVAGQGIRTFLGRALFLNVTVASTVVVVYIPIWVGMRLFTGL